MAYTNRSGILIHDDVVFCSCKHCGTLFHINPNDIFYEDVVCPNDCDRKRIEKIIEDNAFEHVLT